MQNCALYTDEPACRLKMVHEKTLNSLQVTLLIFDIIVSSYTYYVGNIYSIIQSAQDWYYTVPRPFLSYEGHEPKTTMCISSLHF